MTLRTLKEYLRSNALQVSVCLLGLLALGFNFSVVGGGFDHSIYEFYGFRQAQTAISADSILHGGSWLHYATPVLGPPWSIPFEFPLYQMAVAITSHLCDTPLDQTGRCVSLICYYLCFLPLARILTRLGQQRSHMIPALALFAMSPVYVFVSRLFMIESTALLLSLFYTDQMFQLANRERPWRIRHMVGASIFGVVAGVVKVTTLAPYFVLGTSLAAWHLNEDRKQGKPFWKSGVLVLLTCVAFPIAVTWRWTKYADMVKAQNPFGIFLTSKALTGWNFGTLSQRLHPRIYLQLFYGADNHVGSVWLAMAVLCIYAAVCRKWSATAAVCVALYIGTMLIFFNLYVVHEYYSYANAIFLVVGTGVLIAKILQTPGRTAWLGVAVMISVMACCGYRYLTHFYPLQRKNAPGRAATATIIDRITEPTDLIVVEGLDWSAELPYQAQRRAIMDAKLDPRSHNWTLKPLEAAIANAQEESIGALVACSRGRYEPYLPQLLHTLKMNRLTDLHADDCDIYERPATASN